MSPFLINASDFTDKFRGLFAPIQQMDSIKVCWNVGCLMDVPTGEIIFGKYGEAYINGGMGHMVGFVGGPNTSKSTLSNGVRYRAMNTVLASTMTASSEYDTENTANERRQVRLFQNQKYLFRLNPIANGIIRFTDKATMLANKYFEVLKEGLERKIGTKEGLKKIVTPFLDRDGVSPFMIYPPTFGSMDSITEMTTEHEEKMMDDNELGDSGANTLWLKAGAIRTRLFMELSNILPRTSHFMTVVAHLGKEGPAMSAGPMPQAPQKQLQGMKNGTVIKGATSKFTFLTTICWVIDASKPLWNGYKATDGAKYPLDNSYRHENDVDLLSVDLTCIRNKNGPTYFKSTQIFSQAEGVKVSLTELDYIKDRDWGILGNNTNYQLVLVPDVTLNRTTVRRKTDQDIKLQRALNIMSEMLQFRELKSAEVADVLCTPQELYADLKAQGYNWDLLLSTRFWWTPNNYEFKDQLQLTSVDLMRMRKGLYFPYWMDPETKEIHKDWQTEENMKWKESASKSSKKKDEEKVDPSVLGEMFA